MRKNTRNMARKYGSQNAAQGQGFVTKNVLGTMQNRAEIQNTGNYAPYAKTPDVQFTPLILKVVYLFFFLNSLFSFLFILS